MTSVAMSCDQEEICSPDPWVILHKIDSPTKMRYIGSKVASCNISADAVGVAPSIAPWVKPKGELAVVPLPGAECWALWKFSC